LAECSWATAQMDFFKVYSAYFGTHHMLMQVCDKLESQKSFLEFCKVRRCWLWAFDD
jgi:hypothetical protein